MMEVAMTPSMKAFSSAICKMKKILLQWRRHISTLKLAHYIKFLRHQIGIYEVKLLGISDTPDYGQFWKRVDTSLAHFINVAALD